MYRLTLLLGISAFCFSSACSESRPSNVTPGAAKKHIEIGKTSMAEVVEVFGSPNIVTRKDKYEMWVYDKVSSNQTSSFIGAGGGGGGFGGSSFGGGGISAGAGSTTRSETTVMLIVYFDINDVVQDYKISQTKF